MKVLKEFRDFINKGNVVDLAVAVIIGGAFGKIVSALVADMVMPLVNSIMPQGDWRKWEVSPLHFRIGDFLGTVVDFTIVAFIVFIIMVKIVGTVNRKVAVPETKQCPECLETVPKAAKRCRACTSVLTVLALALLTATASVEAPFNLNHEGAALDASTGPPASKGVSAFHDTRVAGKLGLTTTLLARLSVGFGFTLRYDQNPPPRPIPPGTPSTLNGYISTFQPFSDKVDTQAEATLIYTFI